MMALKFQKQGYNSGVLLPAENSGAPVNPHALIQNMEELSILQ